MAKYSQKTDSLHRLNRKMRILTKDYYIEILKKYMYIPPKNWPWRIGTISE